jgi:hypothetical protein
MRNSRSHIPSLSVHERFAPEWDPGRDPLRLRSLMSPADRLTPPLHRDLPDRTVER